MAARSAPTLLLWGLVSAPKPGISVHTRVCRKIGQCRQVCTWYKGLIKSTLPKDRGRLNIWCCQNICLYHTRIDEGDEISW